MTDFKLPPLPEEDWNVRYGYYADAVKTYATECVAEAVKAKDAEIKALRADMADYMRIANVEATRAERLAEALQDLIALPEATEQLRCLDKGIGTATDKAAWLRARALLRDQEEGK